MDGTPEAQEHEDADMKDSAVPVDRQELVMPSIEPLDQDALSSGFSQKSATQHKRGVSIDMLADNSESSAGGTTGPQVSDPDQRTNSEGAYATPASGLSSIGFTDATKSKSSTTNTSSSSQVKDLPSIDEQVSLVTTIASQPLQDGQKGFLVSMAWLARVRARETNAQSLGNVDKAAMEGEIGPIDNTNLPLVLDISCGNLKDEAGEKFIPLKQGLQMAQDFEVVPPAAWEYMIEWYGLAPGSPTIIRYCHNTSSSDTTENLQYELYPPIFTILRLPDRTLSLTPKTLKEKSMKPTKIVASRHESFQKFLRRAKENAAINLKSAVRVWSAACSINEPADAGMLTPAHSSRGSSPVPATTPSVDPGKSMILDVPAFETLKTQAQFDLIDVKDSTLDKKYNGHSNIGFHGLTQDGIVVLEEQIGGPGGGEWVTGAAASAAKLNGIAISVTKNGNTAVQNKTKLKSGNALTPAPTGMMTRGRAKKSGRTLGTIGLGNLGNTCYMNSALQCVRSVEELTQYFLHDSYKSELNPRNPLAHNGEVAKAYANLLKELYSDAAYSSFSPRHFKQIIGKYGPSFSGYGQQDTQEFLLFLLDGLQEDLNRVLQKPYIEKPDSTDEMVHNPTALAAMADECWEIYKARNNSVITDLFAGQYKSTVVCPVCDKVSIIFDPFNNLTVQLPIENVWSKVIFYFPLYQPPIRVQVDIDKNASFAALKEMVAKKTGGEPKKMILAEIYKNKFFRVFDDKKSISDDRIADSDIVAIYELEDTPTNYPPPIKKIQKTRSMLYTHDSEEDIPEGDSALADKMLISVFLRMEKDSASRFNQKQIFGVPSFIVLAKEEARNYDSILAKVLANVMTMTTRDIMEDEDSSDDQGNQDEPDTVIMTNEDLDSSSDTKVQAASVQSEDGLVDVSMQSNGAAQAAGPRVSYPPEQQAKRRKLPRMLQKGEFIAPKLQNLFEMKVYTGSEMIPTGWNTFNNESEDYPSLASRIPRPRKTLRPVLNRQSSKSSESSSSSDELEEQPAVYSAGIGSLDDQESDSDGQPEVRRLDQSASFASRRFSKSNTGKKKRKLITYSKRDKYSLRRGMDGADDDEDEDELASDPNSHPPLLKMGEALVLDWSQASYDALFGASPDDSGDERGCDTSLNIPTLPDPNLTEKRELRQKRKRNGVSLDDCLDEFEREETLSENDAWYCPRCKEHQRASKKFQLWKAPDILVIHLKRFSAQGRLRDKLDVFVDFPVEGLDLTNRVVVQEKWKSPIYDLFAVDNHYGGLGGGHYTAFAKNFNDETWYEYNDSSASRVAQPQKVVTQAAYLLFYRRRSPSKVLGGPFFEDLLTITNNEPPASSPDDPSTDDNDANTESPSGEGRRPTDSSRNGLSGALAGVGAVHQAGAGGVRRAEGGRAGTETELERGVEGDADAELEGLDDELLPTYSIRPQAGEQSLKSAQAPGWNFDNVGGEAEYDVDDEKAFNVASAQPPSNHLVDDDPVDEDLFEDASTKAVSSNGGSVGSVEGLESRMRDFDDEDFGEHGEADESFRLEGLQQRYGTPVDGRQPSDLYAVEADGSSPPGLVPGGQRFNKIAGLSGYNSEVEDEVAEVKLSDEEKGKSGE